MAKKKIGFIPKQLIMVAISVLSGFVAKINIEWVQDSADELLLFLEGVIKDLSDNDLNDSAQLKARVAQHSPQFVDANFKGVDRLISKVNDPSLQLAAQSLVDPVKDILKVSLDDNPENKEQLKAILDKYKVSRIDIAAELLANAIEKKDDSLMSKMVVTYLRTIDPNDFFKEEDIVKI